MPKQRIESKEELLDFVIDKYKFYRKIFTTEHSDHVSKYYLNDFLSDLLLIQHFASKEEDNDTVEGTG